MWFDKNAAGALGCFLSDGIYTSACRNGAHTLFERDVRCPEEAGVVGGIGHHFFDIVSRFGKRDGFGIYRTLKGDIRLPSARPAGAGVIACGSEDFVVLQAAFGVRHIPRSHTDITVGGVKLCGIHTDFAGNFACAPTPDCAPMTKRLS